MLSFWRQCLMRRMKKSIEIMALKKNNITFIKWLLLPVFAIYFTLFSQKCLNIFTNISIRDMPSFVSLKEWRYIATKRCKRRLYQRDRVRDRKWSYPVTDRLPSSLSDSILGPINRSLSRVKRCASPRTRKGQQLTSVYGDFREHRERRAPNDGSWRWGL